MLPITVIFSYMSAGNNRLQVYLKTIKCLMNGIE